MSDAAAQGLTPILYRWLTASGSDQMPPPSVIGRIKASAFRLAARNIALAQEAVSIFRTFETRQIACAPVRGLALAELLYGNLAQRPMGDIDLLVHRKDLSVVAAILRDLGFQEIDRRPGFAQAFSYTLEFFKDRNGWIIVEPHWTIAYPPFAEGIDMDAVWGRCEKGQVVGADTWQLSRSDLVVHLCLHLIHRGESAPLLWFYELDCLLRKSVGTLDWSQIVRLAQQSGLQGYLSEVFGQLKTLFDSPIPSQVLGSLQKPSLPHPARSVGRSFERRIVGLLVGESRADGRESLALFFIIKGLRAKVRYALALLFPSHDFMRLEYGLSTRRQLASCYLSRLAFLFWEGLKSVRSLLRQTDPLATRPSNK